MAISEATAMHLTNGVEDALKDVGAAQPDSVTRFAPPKFRDESAYALQQRQFKEITDIFVRHEQEWNDFMKRRAAANNDYRRLMGQ